MSVFSPSLPTFPLFSFYVFFGPPSAHSGGSGEERGGYFFFAFCLLHLGTRLALAVRFLYWRECVREVKRVICDEVFYLSFILFYYIHTRGLVFIYLPICLCR